MNIGRQGMNFMDAAIAGTKDVSQPVIFSIATTIIAFVPLLLLPGETGKFWWPLPVVVIVILAVSLLEALFILPSHLGHLTEKKPKGLALKLENWQQSFADAFDTFINNYYRPVLDKCLEYQIYYP